ncbi:MAG: tRNA pseudouridine(55) synthase TruB [Balneolales bacterium]
MASVPDPISGFPVFDREHPPGPSEDYASGAIFLVDKEVGWTSFDVVKFLRNRIRIRKTGHAGTLDPLASGLLILCSGKSTRSISRIQEFPKRYRAMVQFGASTPSQDAATNPDATAPFNHLNHEIIETMIKNRFTGVIKQIPPMYSALWKDGQRLYKLARKGQVVERESREAIIHAIEVISYRDGQMELDVLCGKGTYIRTLAHDMGVELGTLAHLSALRRTETGSFHVDQALTIEAIRNCFQTEFP